MTPKVDPEKIKYFIRSKINQYLKNKAYSSAKLREKLLILPKRYPQHPYYPEYSAELIDEVIKEMEDAGFINQALFAEEIYQNLEFRPLSNAKIWEYLEYKQLFEKDLVAKLRETYAGRDESTFLNEILRKLKIKITKWQRKYNNYEVEQKIKQELYKDKWLPETVELILEELKKKKEERKN